MNIKKERKTMKEKENIHSNQKISQYLKVEEFCNIDMISSLGQKWEIRRGRDIEIERQT